MTVEVLFNLGFFSLEGNPSFCMRVLYCGCVLYVYFQREKQIGRLRENIGYYNGSTVGFVSSIFVG